MLRPYFCRLRSFLLAFVFLWPLAVLAQAPTISYGSAITGLNAPVDIVNAGDGTNRLFIVQQGGIINVWNGTSLSQFADFGATGANIIVSGGEQGLLSMAFHPGYDGVTNRYFFIYYTDIAGNIAVTRYQSTAGNINTADLATATPTITIPHPVNSNHNGGKLNFGTDGYLYFATGDGGGGNDGPNNAQNGEVLLGKMLRLNIDQTSTIYGNYDVPADNPYVDDPAIDDRIFALGLRNPFRWSFDRLTGDMWIGDVGQNLVEEINYRAAGSTAMVNYGWRCFEGLASTPGVPDCTPVNYVPPVYEYPNPDPGSSAVTGGYVYRGSEFPNFQGYYIAADAYSGNVYILWPNGSGGFNATVQTGLPVSFVVSFGEGEDGTLYAASQATNIVYRVIATGGGPLPVTLTSFQGAVKNGYNELLWSTSAEINTSGFHVEFSRGGSSFERAGFVAASRQSTGSDYSFSHVTDNSGDILYRLAMEDDDSKIAYSPVIRLTGAQKTGVRVYPSLVKNGVINVALNGNNIHSLKLVSTTGLVVFRKEIRNNAGTISVTLPYLPKGIYIVELGGDAVSHLEKIMIE